jgi:adenylate cyclase
MFAAKHRSVIILSTLLTLGVFLTFRVSSLETFSQGFEEFCQKRLIMLLKTRPIDYSTVVVGIDEPSFAALKQEPSLREFHAVNWPWPPRLHARLLQQLAAAGADRVAFDILFSESFDACYLPEYASPAAFINARAATDIPVVLAAVLDQNLLLPLEIYRRNGFLWGLINMNTTAREEIRRYSFQRDGHPSLAYALAAAEGGEKELVRLGWAGDLLSRAHHLQFVQDPRELFPTLSYADVLLNRVPVEVQARWGVKTLQELLNGKAVLVGPTASTFQDLHKTPLGTIPGVYLHAYAFLQLQRHAANRWRDLSSPAVAGIFLGALLAGTVAFFSFSKFWWNIFTALFLLGYAFGAAWALKTQGIFLPYSEWYGAFFLQTFLLKIGSSAIDREEKSFVQGVFGKYLSPAVAEKLLADPSLLRLGGEERHITILFSDIAGFTTISERLPPTELIKILNQFLGKMAREIMSRDGTLDKYIGDAIMAFWGAPVDMANTAELGCRAALAMQEKAREFNAVPPFSGAPPLNCRIGLNTGKAIVGNAGSEERFSYTAIGDAVNAASRFESLGKKYGVSIIIGEATFAEVRELFDVRLLDRVRVKGKTEPTHLYELLSEKGKSDAAFGELHQKAMDAYFARDFVAAATFFEKKWETYHDEQSRLFLDRLRELGKNPTLKAAFDGTWNLTEK